MKIDAARTGRLLEQGRKAMGANEQRQADGIARKVVAAVEKVAAKQAAQADGYWWVQVFGAKDALVGPGPGDDARRNQLIISEVSRQLSSHGFDVRGVERSGSNTFVTVAQNETVKNDGEGPTVVVHW